MTKVDLIQALQDHTKFCVLATSNLEGKPESAVVAYAVQNDGTIIISTTNTSRKYRNILENNKVAFVTGWTFDEINIQLEGKALLIEPGNSEYKDLDTFFFTVNPHAAKFKTDGTIFVKVLPSWARITDYQKNPQEKNELVLYNE